MPPPARFWLGFWAGFAALNLALDRRGWSLCSTSRALGHLDTKAGRAAFTALYGVGAMGLYAHVVKGEVLSGPEGKIETKAARSSATNADRA